MKHEAPVAFLDAAYAADAAGVGCVLADSWAAATPIAEFSRRFACFPAEYVSGAFYKRELPLLQAVIEELGLHLAIVVIDGYVWLGPDHAPGLGARLFEALGETIPVVGVAKTRYQNDTWSERVHRGNSSRPLFVTAAGIGNAEAAELIGSMHGNHRIPTLLQRADRLARAALL
jgi:deoxyribonuclease V